MDFDLRCMGTTIGKDRIIPLTFSLLNHSCCPNAKISYLNDLGTLRCIRPIQEGEEILVSYIDEFQDVLSRRYFFLELTGAKCLCPRCAANFGQGGDVLSRWICPSCREVLEDEAVHCACGLTVTAGERRSRRGAEQRFWELLGQETRRFLKVAGSGIAEEIKNSMSTVSKVLSELHHLRPYGSPASIKAASMLRSAYASVQRGSPQLNEFARRMELDYCKELAKHHSLLAEEVAAFHKLPSSVDDDVLRRLVSALRLHELVAPACGGATSLRRVGPKADGGYVVFDQGNWPICKNLLSYGVGTNVDFEWELASSGTKVILFDHTVHGLPRQHPNITFVQEALCDRSLPGAGNTLSEHLRLCHQGSLMLKMDVEGAEFSALLASKEIVGHFDQICLELHWLGRPHRSASALTKALALELLQEHFVLLHAHGNSYGDVMEVAGCLIPDVLEVLYVNRRLLSPTQFRPNAPPVELARPAVLVHSTARPKRKAFCPTTF
ncbi:unnamed protein product [Durusdinium trenchii]|uniref:SET domain-containing protein n=1 Tax=Durusdinium trenchii TaxID=1381693 RepID=A0ABP0S4I6_9DINO